MGKSYRENRAKGLDHFSSDGYGYDFNRPGNKGYKVANRQKGKKSKFADRNKVYEDRERLIVDYR